MNEIELSIDRAVIHVNTLASLGLDLDLDLIARSLRNAMRAAEVIDGWFSPDDLATAALGALRLAYELTHNLSFDIARAEDRDRNAARERIWSDDQRGDVFERIRARTLATARADERLGRVYDVARQTARRLEDSLRDACAALDESIAGIRDGDPAPEPEVGANRSFVVSSSARRLVAAAARLLPRANRALYAEEFKGELKVLSEQGLGWLGQVRYSARQLVRAPSLRNKLKTARRRGA